MKKTRASMVTTAVLRQSDKKRKISESSEMSQLRKSERKRKTREFPYMSEPRQMNATWSDAEEISLLKALKEFRDKTGSEPKSMKEFFEVVKVQIGKHSDEDKVYHKIRRLKSKFFTWGNRTPTGDHDKALYQLSCQVWRASQGGDKTPAYDDKSHASSANDDVPLQVIIAENRTDKYPFLTEDLLDYCKMDKAYFEKALKQVDPSRVKELEMKWKKHREADLRFRMKTHELIQEGYALILDGIKKM